MCKETELNKGEENKVELTSKEKEALSMLLGAMSYYDVMAVLARACPDDESEAEREELRSIITKVYIKVSNFA